MTVMDSRPERFESLDFLRGIALLGILLLNIISMAGPYSWIQNPTAYGDFSGVNQFTWYFTHIFAEQKFIAIFGMLFGAGIVLFARSFESKGLPAKSQHFRRMGWLALFGIAHGWLLWYGDILLPYAVGGCLAWLWRNKSARFTFIWGLVFYSVPALLIALLQAAVQHFDADMLALSEASWAPSQAQITSEIAAMQGNFSSRIAERWQLILTLQTDSLLLTSLWLVLGYMLIGMALLKWGALTVAKESTYRYLALLAVPGLALSAYGVYYRTSHDFAFEYSMYGGMLWNYVGSLLTALGYIGLFMLCFKASAAAGFKQRVQAVGRLAFSLYIMHSVIGMILFNWLGLFAQFNRFELLLITLFIWAVQLWLAPWYLERFSRGPLETIWRRLTYKGKRASVETN